MPSEPIGFIGLGAMGLPMASCLANAGWTVIACDAAPSETAWRHPGFAWASTPGDVTGHAATIVLSLPHAQASAIVADALIAAPGGCQRVIDTGTQDPARARAFADRFQAIGIGYCDAPVFGTPRDAPTGALTIAYSCADALRQAVEPVLKGFSRRQIHVGPVGTASLFKVMQNALGLAQLVAIAETFAVVEKAGADLGAFYDVVAGSGGMADNPFFAKVGRDLVERQPRFGALLRVAMKHIELGRMLADRVGAEAALIAAAADLFKRAQRLGMGDADLTSIGQALGRATDA